MRAHTLVDLYVPARLGSPRDLQQAARDAGLDALVYVVEDPHEAPAPSALESLDPGGPHVFVAPCVSGPGFRFACLLPTRLGLDVEAIEAQGDPVLVQNTVRSMGGLALPVAPRQAAHGTSRTVSRLATESRCGVVSMLIPGSRLGRDLDLEDTILAERVVLGASGPFTSLRDIGRYATLLPFAMGPFSQLAANQQRIIASLSAGHGVAVEQIFREPRHKPNPDPREGRDDEHNPERKKRRRRRRGKSKSGGQPA